MADSISNNWTTKNNLLSGENVSHVDRDHTPEFIIDQTSIYYFLFHHIIIVLFDYQFIESKSNNFVLMHICYLLIDF